MGVCYSQQQQWQAFNNNLKSRRKEKKKLKKTNPVIQQQQSIYEKSFNDPAQSFRQSNEFLNQIFSEASIAIGSVVELNETQQQALQKSLETINSNAEPHNQCDVLSLCNLKSKNFLHTHRVRLSHLPRENEVSCCPFNSNHIVEYDLWKLIKSESVDKYLIYHPFTQRFLNVKNGQIVCSVEKMEWTIQSFGKRRKGGYLKILCQMGEVCMTSERGLLPNHRKLKLCNGKHIAHIWEIKFGEIIDMSAEFH